MSQLMITLGLQKLDMQPTRSSISHDSKKKNVHHSHLLALNEKKAKQQFDKLTAIMRDMLMSTTDIAYRLNINRDSAWRYMDRLSKRGKAYRVGETIHAGSTSKSDIWKLIYAKQSTQSHNG